MIAGIFDRLRISVVFRIFIRVVVAFFYVDLLEIGVHARDTTGAFYTKLDVATSAPAGTPRVLDEPVALIVVLLHFRLDLSKVVLVLNDVVPAAFAVFVAEIIGSNESVVSLALLIFTFLGRGLLASSVHVSFLIVDFMVRFGIAIDWLGIGIG